MDGKLRNMTSVYLTGEQGILCLYRIGSRVANNKYIGSAGGHFEKEELNDAKACILRELSEELSLTQSQIRNLQLRYVSLRNMNDEIRQNYYFFAELSSDVPNEISSTEGMLKWVPFQETDQYPMPFTAKYVVDHYINTGRHTDHLYGGIGNDDGMVFTKL